MKSIKLSLVLSILLLLFFSCQPLDTIKVETVVPASIDFPGNFNKVVFINLETDLNDDNETDTLLYRIITQEMNLGFIDAIESTAGIDSSRFLYLKGIPNKNRVYDGDTISWYYLGEIAKKSNADIFIILDSLKLNMNNEAFTDHYSYPVEYYRYRELSINAFWSVYDIIEKKRLDKFNYTDTLYWEKMGYVKAELDKKMPGVEQCIREASYFTAADYTKRVFPGWQTEFRHYFVNGNKDFRIAAELVKNGKWEEAVIIWEKYTQNFDKELSSRACFNLALANEMSGDINTAIAWAETSEKIKKKSRTRYYIYNLKKRKEEIEKLNKQVY